ncbi:MAG: hypothetical protein WAL26_08765 [Mycobacterium sp.]
MVMIKQCPGNSREATIVRGAGRIFYPPGKELSGFLAATFALDALVPGEQQPLAHSSTRPLAMCNLGTADHSQLIHIQFNTGASLAFACS